MNASEAMRASALKQLHDDFLQEFEELPAAYVEMVDTLTPADRAALPEWAINAMGAAYKRAKDLVEATPIEGEPVASRLMALLRKAGPTCSKCGHTANDHHYRHPFEALRVKS